MIDALMELILALVWGAFKLGLVLTVLGCLMMKAFGITDKDGVKL